jgi:hypothetical protein
VAQPLNRLVTIGIQPTHPESGYGYLRASRTNAGRWPAVFRVAQFVEKPSHTGEQFWRRAHTSGIAACSFGVRTRFGSSLPHLPQLATPEPVTDITAADPGRCPTFDPRLPSVSIDVGSWNGLECLDGFCGHRLERWEAGGP